MQIKTSNWTNEERTKSTANSTDDPIKRNVIPGHSNKSSATWNAPASDEVIMAFDTTSSEQQDNAAAASKTFHRLDHAAVDVISGLECQLKNFSAFLACPF
jgi:hypothetical protein